MKLTLESFRKSAIRTNDVGKYLINQGYENQSGIVYPIKFDDGKTHYVYIGIEGDKYYLELLNDIYYSKDLSKLEDRLFNFVISDMEVISVIVND